MAVLVTFTLPRATAAQLAASEQRAQERGAAAGGPPYPGLMFLAITAIDGGFRCVSAWRAEQQFRAVHEAMLGPDLSSASLSIEAVSVAPIVSMALPGAHAG
jgi:hypothetical protein